MVLLALLSLPFADAAPAGAPAAASAAAPAAAPGAQPAGAMVTLVRGSVTLVDGKVRTPAPPAPFLLRGSQSLDVGAGGHVVLLRQGGAFTVDGPKLVDPGAFQVAAQTDVVGSLLAKKTSLASAGAARSAALELRRPLPASQALALHEVEWRCNQCGVQPVEVLDLRTDAVLWSGQGEGSLAYAGPALAPGSYLVRVGGNEFSLRVQPPAEADAALAAARVADLADPRDRLTATASALLLAGYPSDALWTLESGGATELVADFERAAGLLP